MSRSAVFRRLFLCALLGVGTAAAASATPTLYPDSTVADRWTLANGLEVVMRHVPGAQTTSVAWGFRIGQDDDPVERPGLAMLLAETAFTAAAGEVPDRTREDMESIRPEGWDVRVNRRQTLFTEGATPRQFPGVLHQVAVRMRGVTVAESVLVRARATVRRLLGERYFGSLDRMLGWQLGEYARGLDKNDILALSAARGLDLETPESVQRAIARAYVPANGVLVLAGDLRGLDVRAVVESEFGGLPAGERLPEPPRPRLDSAAVLITRAEAPYPMNVLGIIAPALTDSIHPSFYMAMLVLGQQAKQTWGTPARPLTSRFQYSLLDDPELVRFYPRLPGLTTRDPHAPQQAFTSMVQSFFEEHMLTADVYDDFRRSVLWLLGGPMSQGVLASVRRDGGALNLLAVSCASRALWGSDAFWAEYRRLFDPRVSPDVSHWRKWLADPSHRVSLMIAPRR